jgi:V8-like Glu-specific endopeptidase
VTTRRKQPVLEWLEGRALLSLSGIAPNAGFPFTAIVELKATFPDHKTYVGTGAMIDSFHVLTAGHVIYSYADGGFATSVLATPELYGNSQPFGTAWMTYERTFNAFMSYNRTHPGTTAPGDYDIGLITLNRNIGYSTGWMNFGYDNNNADFARGSIYNTAGYPAAGGYDSRHMEFSAGSIAGLSPDGSALQYYQSSITAYGGQSGSPVWRYTPSTNTQMVYAVHVGGNGTAGSLNIATRITQPIFNALQQWRFSDAVPRSTQISTYGLTLPPGNAGAVAATPSSLVAATQASPVRTLKKASPAVTAELTAQLGAAIPHGPRWIWSYSTTPRRKFV